MVESSLDSGSVSAADSSGLSAMPLAAQIANGTIHPGPITFTRNNPHLREAAFFHQEGLADGVGFASLCAGRAPSRVAT